MKLLLVEDERLTREGILESVNWGKLNITEVREAVDGIEALAVTGHYSPDLVLTDIKMPRMDGVALAFQIRRKYPNCKIVFMSGYADKEYLKAAITLKAVSYVEKPLDVNELEEALASAVSLHEEERKQQQMISLSREKERLLKRQIALKLIRPQWNEESMLQEMELLSESISPKAGAVTCLVRMDRDHPDLDELEQLLEDCASEYRLTTMVGSKDEVHLVIHMISDDRSRLSSANLKGCLEAFSSKLKELQVRHDISIGKKVAGLIHLHESYTAAVLILQESFYRGPYSLRLHEDTAYQASKESYIPEPKLLERIKESLYQEQYDETEKLLRRLTSECRDAPSTPVNQVKELYYRLLLEIEHYFNDLGITADARIQGPSIIWERMSECFYLSELHQMLVSKIHEWKQSWEAQQHGSGYITSSIMKYVHQHYAESELSVQEISEHLQLTSSYVISIFKEATGTTVKQYVLEYRIERAKELLKQRGYKISDIAAQVGFKDGEYFAKVFRKFTGMTPSEYRERFQ